MSKTLRWFIYNELIRVIRSGLIKQMKGASMVQIPKKYKGKFFYHFTHLDNIESVVRNGILSTNEKKRRKIGHTDLANEKIQERRSDMDVPVNPYGKIHDYVPFYFASTNPMLLSVLNRKNIDQHLVVFIAISIEKLLEDEVIFTDAAANTTIPPNFFNDPKYLDNLKWDLIDSKKWGTKDNDFQSRMAEVLIYNKAPIEYIDHYVVYNDTAKKKIKEIYKEYELEKPTISFEEIYGEKFYFTKYFFEDRKNDSLITGPKLLNHNFTILIEKITSKREKQDCDNYKFININNALEKIKSNFCIIGELEGIYELNTHNEIHKDNVSDHTLKVVSNIKKNEYYVKLSDRDKKLVELAAYFHDIGKGPKSKWKDGIQWPYADHPADAIPMLYRILTMDFESLSKYEIRKICLLVVYHDIIGDILKDDLGRSEKELLDLEIDENELNMLICISIADISSIKSLWENNIRSKLPMFIKRILKEI